MLANLQVRGVLGDDDGGGGGNNDGGGGGNNDGGGGGNNDNTPPVITLNNPLTAEVEIGSTYVEPGYVAMDNKDGNITANVSVSGTVDANTVGTYTLNYDVSDTAGNAATTVSRTVNVISLDSDNDGIQNNVDVEPEVVSTAFVDSDTTNGYIVSSGDQTLLIKDADNAANGVIISSDATGGANSAEINICNDTSTIFLDANESALVTCGSVDIQVVVGTIDVVFYGDNGLEASTTLLVDDKILFDQTKFEFTNSGTNDVTFSVNSKPHVISNNNSPVIIDVIAPIITIPTDKTFEATAIFTPLTTTQIGVATATDGVDPSPIVSSNATATYPLGNTLIQWNATDSSGNTVSITQTKQYWISQILK